MESSLSDDGGTSLLLTELAPEILSMLDCNSYHKNYKYINSGRPSIRDQENLCILQAVGFNQLFFKYFSVI